ncbi:glycosyltransferase family 2 protein [Asticcacaulis sp. EMRT-3]|uniref:glycosyltransferase family 2 protein n=1 Tax=Asticcacaulis sp. EMRT-3 TaxID=3040349 RepID=UPI0024AEEBBE|nr:glycosyltransferase family 2 protein [Asticcacaulis sp. EMRT-3]MDI7776272.1 glycosyltransferase family 2 protein [Asticcacaulis sp. EMRT-3]
MKISLSICIICKNEEDRIGACLDSVQGLSDDVVVVDSGSTDTTTDIARAAGARVFHNPWSGYGPQKRFSEDMARHSWILNLDADEVLSPAIAREIRTLLEKPPQFVAYRLKIMTIYPDKTAPRLWADYNNYVRLYDRRQVRFRESPVHDTVDTGLHKVGQLQGQVLHFSARSYAHIRQKLAAYTDLQARTLRKSRLYIALRLPFEYPATFFRYYIMRRHVTGGWDGILSSHLAAEARFGRLLKMWAYKASA